MSLPKFIAAIPQPSAPRLYVEPIYQPPTLVVSSEQSGVPVAIGHIIPEAIALNNAPTDLVRAQVTLVHDCNSTARELIGAIKMLFLEFTHPSQVSLLQGDQFDEFQEMKAVKDYFNLRLTEKKQGASTVQSHYNELSNLLLKLSRVNTFDPETRFAIADIGIKCVVNALRLIIRQREKVTDVEQFLLSISQVMERLKEDPDPLNKEKNHNRLMCIADYLWGGLLLIAIPNPTENEDQLQDRMHLQFKLIQIIRSANPKHEQVLAYKAYLGTPDRVINNNWLTQQTQQVKEAGDATGDTQTCFEDFNDQLMYLTTGIFSSPANLDIRLLVEAFNTCLRTPDRFNTFMYKLLGSTIYRVIENTPHNRHNKDQYIALIDHGITMFENAIQAEHVAQSNGNPRHDNALAENTAKSLLLRHKKLTLKPQTTFQAMRNNQTTELKNDYRQFKHSELWNLVDQPLKERLEKVLAD